MKLCFASFCMVLMGNRKNNSVTQEKMCRTLFDMLIPNFTYGYESSYFSLFANRNRDLPKKLKETKHNAPDIAEQFEYFIADFLTYDYSDLLAGLRYLIAYD